jgi:hypothetical protein
MIEARGVTVARQSGAPAMRGQRSGAPTAATAARTAAFSIPGTDIASGPAHDMRPPRVMSLRLIDPPWPGFGLDLRASGPTRAGAIAAAMRPASHAGRLAGMCRPGSSWASVPRDKGGIPLLRRGDDGAVKRITMGPVPPARSFRDRPSCSDSIDVFGASPVVEIDCQELTRLRTSSRTSL